MIRLRYNYFLKYRIFINDDNVKLKYKCWMKYNLFNVTTIEDEIDLDDTTNFKKAKRIMIDSINALNKILN